VSARFVHLNRTVLVNQFTKLKRQYLYKNAEMSTTLTLNQAAATKAFEY